MKPASATCTVIRTVPRLEGAPVRVDTGFAGGCAAHVCEF
jgi:hypothetical protein